MLCIVKCRPNDRAGTSHQWTGLVSTWDMTRERHREVDETCRVWRDSRKLSPYTTRRLYEFGELPEMQERFPFDPYWCELYEQRRVIWNICGLVLLVDLVVCCRNDNLLKHFTATWCNYSWWSTWPANYYLQVNYSMWYVAVEYVLFF